jgi:hypothetical protein
VPAALVSGSGGGVAGPATGPSLPVLGGALPRVLPGLNVLVLDGQIVLSNQGANLSFSAGQFGFTAQLRTPPVVVPPNPGLRFVPPPVLSIQVKTQPVQPSLVTTDALGGGAAQALGSPLDIKVVATNPDAAAQQVPLPAALADVQVQLLLPVPTPVTPGQSTGWLMSVDDPPGQTVGYTRPPSTIDPASGLILLTPTLGELGGTLFLPVVFQQAFVRNFDPDVHIWSNPFSTAVDFGVAAPQWTRMEVLAPVVGSRLPVLNASTGEPGWVDAAGVGPVSADDGLPAIP